MSAALPRLVVLDLDGTLARLEVDWAALRGRLAAELSAAGRAPQGGVLATLRALAGDPDPAAARLHARCSALVRDAELRAARTAPINWALLDWLMSERSAPAVALLTLNHGDAARAVAARTPLAARIGPADVIGRDDAPPKPDPQGLHRLLAAHGLRAPDAVFVGDAASDEQCARAAGVPFLHVARAGVEFWCCDEIRAAA